MTAVEWLMNELSEINRPDLVSQTLEMEKNQIINAYIAGDVNGVESMIDNGGEWLDPECYYNETFNK